MYLLTSRLNIDTEEKKFKIKVARSMIEHEYSNVEIHELLGLSYHEIELARKEIATDLKSN